MKKQLIFSGPLSVYCDEKQIDPRVLVGDQELTRAICEWCDVDADAGETGMQITVAVTIDLLRGQTRVPDEYPPPPTRQPQTRPPGGYPVPTSAPETENR